MKAYPSIPDNYASFYGRKCIAFYKYDGSNMRFLWTAKQGWSRFGTRNNLIDAETPLYSQAIKVFNEKYKERLTWMIRHDKMFQGTKEVIAFAEFFGPSSFAGQHKLNEPKELMLFDINVGGRGFMSPQLFKEKLSHAGIAKIMYEGILDESFANTVRRVGLPAENQKVFEGVIVKGGESHKLWMVKIKNAGYLEQLDKRSDELNNWEQ